MAIDQSTSSSLLTDAIATSASGPKSVSVEGMGASSEHPIKDQIEAAKFLPSSNVRKRVGGGIRFNKMSSGGAV